MTTTTIALIVALVLLAGAFVYLWLRLRSVDYDLASLRRLNDGSFIAMHQHLAQLEQRIDALTPEPTPAPVKRRQGPRSPNVNRPTARRIKTLRREGLAVRDIAARTGYHPTTIYQVLNTQLAAYAD